MFGHVLWSLDCCFKFWFLNFHDADFINVEWLRQTIKIQNYWKIPYINGTDAMFLVEGSKHSLRLETKNILEKINHWIQRNFHIPTLWKSNIIALIPLFVRFERWWILTDLLLILRYTYKQISGKNQYNPNVICSCWFDRKEFHCNVRIYQKMKIFFEIYRKNIN